MNERFQRRKSLNHPGLLCIILLITWFELIKPFKRELKLAFWLSCYASIHRHMHQTEHTAKEERWKEMKRNRWMRRKRIQESKGSRPSIILC